MNEGSRWLVQDDSGSFSIELVRIGSNSRATVSINGMTDDYVLSQVGDSGLFTLLPCGSKRCLLQVGADLTTAALYVDNIPQQPLPPIEAATAPTGWTDTSGLQKKIKSGMSAFLTLLILSVLNTILIWLQASISFPFSIFAAAAATGYGGALTAGFGSNLYLVVGSILAVLIIGFYTLLYFLARRWIWPVWVAFSLIVLDTLLLIGDGLMNDMMASIGLDFLFHAWIIWSLFQLGRAKSQMQNLLRQQVERPAAPSPDLPLAES